MVISKINNINENGYEIEYAHDLNEEAIGGPIYNLNTKKVLGFIKNINSGILLNLPIKEFLEKGKKEIEFSLNDTQYKIKIDDSRKNYINAFANLKIGK